MISDFVEYNTRFWIGIFKYHPLFYHHRIIGWTGPNNGSRISMCPMAHSQSAWRSQNGLGFLDSFVQVKRSIQDVLFPSLCHMKKLETCMTCSRLEQHFAENLPDSKDIFHGGLHAMTKHLKDHAKNFISLRVSMNRQPCMTPYRVVYSCPRYSNLTIRSHDVLNPCESSKSCATEKTSSVTTVNTHVPDVNLCTTMVDKSPSSTGMKPVQNIDVDPDSNVSVMSIDNKQPITKGCAAVKTSSSESKATVEKSAHNAVIHSKHLTSNSKVAMAERIPHKPAKHSNNLSRSHSSPYTDRNERYVQNHHQSRSHS